MNKDNSIEEVKLWIYQKLILNYYNSINYLSLKFNILLKYINNFLWTWLSYIIIILVVMYWLFCLLNFINPVITKDNLYSFSFWISWIIWASISIIFSFSTFILQSTSELFSTQYLNKFINNKSEKRYFWILVLLSITSFLTPILYKNYIEKSNQIIVWDNYIILVLVFILLVSFRLIFGLYKQLRLSINPETTLNLIKNDWINQLIKVNKIFNKNSDIQTKIFKYKNEKKDFSLDIQYKTNPNWNIWVLENIKYLYEIWLRLLSKNEINSFNLSVKFIHDILLKHIELRNNHFIRIPVNFLGTYSFNDEGFTTSILEYLQSIWNRVIQERRKENIYFLLKIYENLINVSLHIKYSDKEHDSIKDNPLLSLILWYYGFFIDSLIDSKEFDWTWESIKSVSNISRNIVNETSSYLIISSLNQIIDKISIYSIENKKEVILKEIVLIYFNEILISWNKYSDSIFWKELYKHLKINVFLLWIINWNKNFSLSEIFISFQSNQVNIINSIIENEDKIKLENFIKHLKSWSNFLLDISRDNWLNNQQTGLSIIQSVENNLRIIYWIINKFNDSKLDDLYLTQFYTLSWYFEKVEKVEDSYLFNLNLVLEIIFDEIYNNIVEKKFDNNYLIELYIDLIEKHFSKSSIWYWYNHPRIIVKMVYLGLLLFKFNDIKNTDNIILQMDTLNKKYLELNKDFLKKKEEIENLMWPDKYQFCEELHELQKDLFSYNFHWFDRIMIILRKEISKNEWDMFYKKIDFCKNITYSTTYL